MPELPEVETIRNDLNKKLKGETIQSVFITLARQVRGSSSYFKNFLQGKVIDKFNRRGKLIYTSFQNSDKFLLIHLKMTGQLIYCKGDNLIAGGHSDSKEPSCEMEKHTRLVFEFKNGASLKFNDQRTFGYLEIVDKKRLEEVLAKFGPEPLKKDFSLDYFQKLSKTRSTNIKALLLNQEHIAGIGNIYADESLFMAGILPWRPALSLTKTETEKLHKAIKDVLRLSIKSRGTTFNNYRDAEGNRGEFVKKLKVFGKKGEPCPKCGRPIEKNKTAGRGTHYCLHCQQ
jgi:formamidopyrimidine-DNA glycosylase